MLVLAAVEFFFFLPPEHLYIFSIHPPHDAMVVLVCIGYFWDKGVFLISYINVYLVPPLCISYTHSWPSNRWDPFLCGEATKDKRGIPELIGKLTFAVDLLFPWLCIFLMNLLSPPSEGQDYRLIPPYPVPWWVWKVLVLIKFGVCFPGRADNA